MTRNEVETAVREVLQEVVAAATGGAPMPELGPGERPIGVLPNFDSVVAEDTTPNIFAKLGLTEDDDINPFLKNNRPVTFAEVVDTLHALVNGEA